MKILIVSDAWKPQLNGVVRTYEYLQKELEKLGNTVTIIGPSDFPARMPLPGYKEIELALKPYHRLSKMIEKHAPDALHIATEGPLGRAARKYCRNTGRKFITAYHTQFPEYIAARVGKVFPFLTGTVRRAAQKNLKDFHNEAETIMVATPSLEDMLKEAEFTVLPSRLTRGFDTDIFYPREKTLFQDLPRPISLYVGRVAIEKNLEAFLSIDTPGSKVVVGSGPALGMLQKKYPDVLFAGKKEGAELADHYRSSDVFVFPSKTDTFGIVLIEALACGLPVAAYNVTGPCDIITEPFLGTLADDLGTTIQSALSAPGTPEERNAYARQHYSWQTAAKQFLKALEHAVEN